MAENHSSVWSILGAFMAGAAAGTTVALLTTPRRGSELREEMRNMPNQMKNAYEKASDAARQAFKETYERQTERLSSK